MTNDRKEHERTPCDGCGLCCEHLLVDANFADVLREPRIEAQRPLGKKAVSLSILDASWMLAGPGYPCPFLNAEKRCDIYPTRPTTCVVFATGSSQCRALRREHGLPKLVPHLPLDGLLAEIMNEIIQEEEEGPLLG
ncbi:MAG TPA: YkgJ family cysteine cluster protein [Phycisphaerae bacterium]|nr:YkgJ family cysteine cluster protein [Phycisphaerae bacterium]